jgi:hypothetical protein
MNDLADWLLADHRRSVVLCRAKENGVGKYCCVARSFHRLTAQEKRDWPTERAAEMPAVSTHYADTLEESISGALRP